MLAKKMRRYTGWVALIAALIIFIIVTLATSIYVNNKWLSIDAIGMSQSRSLQQMLIRVDPTDPTLKAEILSHVRLSSNGGELATRLGSVYQFPKITDVTLSNAAKMVERHYAGLESEQKANIPKSYNKFVEAHNAYTQRRANYLSVFRVIAAGIVLLSFFTALGMLLFRLKRADDKVESILSENHNILRTTKDGLFLIDSNHQIGAVQSQAAKIMFGRDHKLSGGFLELIKPLISDDDLADVKEYISLLFECRGRPSLLTDLNPLREVELKTRNSRRRLTSKFLNFDFSRDTFDKAPGILVAVSDITKEVYLKRELNELNEGKREHFENLMTSIVASSKDVSAFYQTTYRTLHNINEMLRDERGAFTDNRHKLKAIYSKIHRVKGNAGLIGMSVVEQSAHNFENKIEQLSARPRIDGEQILSLTVLLKQMINELEFLEQLSAKISDSTKNKSIPTLTEVERTTDKDSNKLVLFANEIARRQNKRINLELHGFHNTRLTGRVVREINSLCAQLVRNAVAHGIEDPELRERRNKPLAGQVTVTLKEKDEHSFQLVVRDDGDGLNLKKIKARAVDLGLVTQHQANKLNHSETVRYIFNPSFSTQRQGDLDAGRGFGLEVVRDDVAKLGGTIGVRSSRGLFSQFTVTLPRSLLLSAVA